MARFAVICYILFGLSNLRVTVCPPPLSSPFLERRTEQRGTAKRRNLRENERIRQGKGWAWTLVEVTTGGRKTGWGCCALRLHSSVNRGIFVRFLFENKTLPTTPGVSKRGEDREERGDRGMRRLKWIGFVRIRCICIYDECLNFSLLSEILVAFDLRLRERNLRSFANYSIINDTHLHIVTIIITPRSSRVAQLRAHRVSSE